MARKIWPVLATRAQIVGVTHADRERVMQIVRNNAGAECRGLESAAFHIGHACHYFLLSARATMSCGAVMVIALLYPLRAHSEDEAPSRDRVLAILESALSRYGNVEVVASTNVDYLMEGEASSETSEVLVRRGGRRALLSSKMCVTRPDRLEPTCRQIDQIVYDNNDILLCTAVLGPSRAQVGGEGNIGASLLSERLAGHQEIDRDSMWFALNDSAAVLWIIGYRPLLDYVRAADNVAFRATASGGEIVANSAYGEAQIVLDRSVGWLPKSIQVTKRPNHLIMGKPLSDASGNEVDKIAWALSAEEFVRGPEGNWISHSLTVRRRANWKSKEPDIWSTSIRIQQINFDPAFADSDFETSIAIPVGYSVGIIGAPHLPYKWDGHAVVPGVSDAPPIRRPDENLPVTSAPSRFWRLVALIVFNVVLALIALAVLWRRAK